MKEYRLIVVPGSKRVDGWKNDYFVSSQFAFQHIDEAKTDTVYFVKARISEHVYETGTPYSADSSPDGITQFRQDVADIVNGIKFDVSRADDPKYVKSNMSAVQKSLESLAREKKLELTAMHEPYDGIRAA